MGLEVEEEQRSAGGEDPGRLADGPGGILRVMEQVSGLRFDSPPYADTLITAVVFEGVSHSGYRETPMRLRASFASASW